MRRFLKIIAWILPAPVVWLAGSLLVCSAPVAYTLERIPLDVPPQALPPEEVAQLNDELKLHTMFRSWSPLPLVMLFNAEWALVVPTAEGGLEAVHVYPSWSWRWHDKPRTEWQTVVQQWAEKHKRESEGKR